MKEREREIDRERERKREREGEGGIEKNRTWKAGDEQVFVMMTMI